MNASNKKIRPMKKCAIIKTATENKCGECSVCCTIMSVEEIGKPVNCHCKHLQYNRIGCRIYNNRPKSCAAFSCSWLNNELDQFMTNTEQQDINKIQFRPDHLGLMVTRNYELETKTDCKVYCVHPINRNAEKNTDAANFIKKLKENNIVVLMTPLRTIGGPPQSMIKLLKNMRMTIPNELKQCEWIEN